MFYTRIFYKYDHIGKIVVRRALLPSPGGGCDVTRQVWIWLFNVIQL